MLLHSSSRDLFKNVYGLPKYVPYELLNEEQAQRNHSQSLDRLNERGGLGVMEMLDNIHKRSLSRVMENITHLNELIAIIERYDQLNLLDYKGRNGNEVIYKFMDVKECVTNTQFLVVPDFGLKKPSELAYHKDWNWIIPVARKCINSYHDKRELIFEALHDCDLEALHHACVLFILWYNDNTEQAKAEMAHIKKLKRNETE